MWKYGVNANSGASRNRKPFGRVPKVIPRLHHDDMHLYPQTNVTTTLQLHIHIPYSFQIIVQINGRHDVNVTITMGGTGHSMKLCSYTFNIPPKYNFLHLRLLRYSLPKILNFKVNMARSTLNIQFNFTQWHCTPTFPTNTPAMYQLPIPHNFQDMAQTRF